MKILVVFIDMIRPNRLSLFNSNVKSDTQLDLSLKKIAFTFINFNFKLLVKQVAKDKAAMSHRVVDYVYEIFDNINESQVFDKKIVIPYQNITMPVFINGDWVAIDSVEDIMACNKKSIKF